ncbi:MAG: nucleotide exchange factor GrpE [Lachnospiraceae bacterium]|nr:nucleotide exchange factor GrpE [Lachnospiraceae bacterium]
MAEQNLNEELDETLEQTEEVAEEATTEEEVPEVEAVEEDEAEAPGDGEAEKAEKKSFFKKKEKKDKRDTQIEELTDRVKRQMAEFDNYRKRTEREKAAMFDLGSRNVIEKMLPVVDNFERGLASIPEADKESPVATGMEMIYKQLMTTLADLGVKPIEAVGQPFDPNFHNAVMHIDDDSFGENVVAEEFQKGYMHHDSVIRCSMVKVAN